VFFFNFKKRERGEGERLVCNKLQTYVPLTQLHESGGRLKSKEWLVKAAEHKCGTGRDVNLEQVYSGSVGSDVVSSFRIINNEGMRDPFARVKT